MFPNFNQNPFHSSQLQPNGPSSSTPQQVGANPGNFCPNPMQMGGMINPQFNQFAAFPFQGPSNLNPNQQMGRFLPQNSVNPSQFMNQNVNLGVPNGQWNMPNPMQNMNMNVNPFFQMGIPNLGQVPQGVSLQNLAFLANAQLSLMNGGVGNQMPNGGLQMQGNLGTTQAFNSVQPQQNPKMFNQAQIQGNPGNDTDDNQTKGNWQKPHNNNYKGNRKQDASHSGSMKFQKQNGKGNFRAHEQRGKGHQDVTPRKPPLGNSEGQNQVERKRPILPSYTDQEIKQWREARRKNYPSKSNVKPTEKLKEPKTDDAAKLRRQQLKEILAKQAELGCEVAEIPSSYLSDSEQRDGKRPYNKKERFQNKYNKRGKFRQNDRFSKRQRFGNPDSSNADEQNNQLPKKQFMKNNEPSNQGGGISKKEPTLLQKLLSADIKRDQRHLVQVFKFMAMNSFFKEFPEKGLKFPTVLVKELGNESEVLEEKGVRESIHKTGLYDSIADDDISATNFDDNDESVLTNHDQEKVGIEEQQPQEEEGEIVD